MYCILLIPNLDEHQDVDNDPEPKEEDGDQHDMDEDEDEKEDLDGSMKEKSAHHSWSYNLDDGKTGI